MSEVSHPPRRWPRLLLLIALSLALHALLVDWGRRQIIMPGATQEQVMAVELRPLPPPEQPVALPVPRPTQPRAAKPASRPAPPARRSEPSIEPPDEPIRETVEPIYTPAPEAPHSTPATATATASDDGTGKTSDGKGQGTAGAGAEGGQAQGDAPGKSYQTSAPPSVLLRYDATGTKDGRASYGRGSIAWRNDGPHYSVEGKAKVLVFTVLNFTSQGDLDGNGLSPELYTEQTGFKSATNTHFNRERNVVSFSASTTTYPRRGGEQDRGSVIWQLSAIGRGDPAQFRAGAVIDMFVAGVRDGDIWRMQVQGEEDVTLPIGQLHTWHVVRMPKPGSYEDRVDIWLAPQHEWYPVRVRYTEPPSRGGDFIDLSLSGMEALPP